MFTGLVEGIARLDRSEPFGGGRRLTFVFPAPADPFRTGESVALAGVCLTVESAAGRRCSFTAVSETLRRTTLGTLRPGATVNFERSLKATDRLGGHFVQGHVDGLGRVLSATKRAGDWRVRIALPPGVSRGLVVEKGSIAVDGVSLTVASARSGDFELALIQETLARTTLAARKSGDAVNLEFDMLAKHVLAALGPRRR